MSAADQPASGEILLQAVGAPFEDGCLTTFCRLVAPDAGDPCLLADERALERLDLVECNNTGRGRCGKAFHSSA